MPIAITIELVIKGTIDKFAISKKCCLTCCGILLVNKVSPSKKTILPKLFCIFRLRSLKGDKLKYIHMHFKQFNSIVNSDVLINHSAADTGYWTKPIPYKTGVIRYRRNPLIRFSEEQSVASMASHTTYTSFKTHLPLVKMATDGRLYIQMHFCEWIVLHFDLNCTVICS